MLGLLLSLHVFHVDRMSKGVWLLCFVVFGIFELLHFVPRTLVIFGVLQIMLLGLASDVISPLVAPKRLIPKLALSYFLDMLLVVRFTRQLILVFIISVFLGRSFFVVVFQLLSMTRLFETLLGLWCTLNAQLASRII